MRRYYERREVIIRTAIVADFGAGGSGQAQGHPCAFLAELSSLPVQESASLVDQ